MFDVWDEELGESERLESLLMLSIDNTEMVKESAIR